MKQHFAIACTLLIAPLFANALPVTLQMNLYGTPFQAGSLTFTYEEDQVSGPDPYFSKFNWLDASLNFDTEHYSLDPETENTMTMYIPPNRMGGGSSAARFNAGFTNEAGEKFSLYLKIEDYDYFSAISLPLFKTELHNDESSGSFSNASRMLKTVYMRGQLSDITVPEPAPFALLLASFAGMFLMRKKIKEQ